MSTTWILVADSSQATLYSANTYKFISKDESLEKLHHFEHPGE